MKSGNSGRCYWLTYHNQKRYRQTGTRIKSRASNRSRNSLNELTNCSGWFESEERKSATMGIVIGYCATIRGVMTKTNTTIECGVSRYSWSELANCSSIERKRRGFKSDGKQ